MPPSLFRAITRYSLSSALDPAENRLTEAFAAVLQRIPKLPSAFVSACLKFDVPEAAPVSIRTQRPTAGGRYVDLELAFGSALVPDLRVWIEIKHGAPLHENQLENYAADLAFESHEQARIALIAPRESMPTNITADTQLEWQSVGAWLNVVRTGFVADSGHRLLLDELVKYLKEESLMDEEALATAHAFVLAARPGADRAVARLLTLADSHIQREWGARRDFGKSGGSKPNYAPGFWWCQHDLVRSGEPPTSWRNSVFEWTLRPDHTRSEARDSYAFTAGATFFTQDNPHKIAGNQAWFAARASDGYERVQDWYWRLWRYLYPERLLAEPSLDAQGRMLANWVIESFELLAADPPPE